LIPQSKLDSIAQLHQQNLQVSQPKVQQTIVLSNQPISNPHQQRQGCC
jgi:hypothetical protein